MAADGVSGLLVRFQDDTWGYCARNANMRVGEARMASHTRPDRLLQATNRLLGLFLSVKFLYRIYGYDLRSCAEIPSSSPIPRLYSYIRAGKANQWALPDHTRIPN